MAVCPFCHGTRTIALAGRELPCTECKGTGSVSCCEGSERQPGFETPEVPQFFENAAVRDRYNPLLLEEPDDENST